MKKKKKNTSFWKSIKQNLKIRFIVKLILSFFVLYHLSMILISPNVDSLAHKKLMPFFAPYASTLALNTSWNLYMPHRAYYYYWTYEVRDSKSKVGVFRWPPKRKESQRIYLNHDRLISHARWFIMAGPRRARRYFIPYLCRLHPSAEKIILKERLKKRKARFFKPQLLSSEDPADKDISIEARCKRTKKLRNIDSHES